MLAQGLVFSAAWPGSPGFQTTGHDPFVDMSQKLGWTKGNGMKLIKGGNVQSASHIAREKYFGRDLVIHV